MARLKDIRESHLITQEELAYKAGVSVRTISRLESGGSKPRFRTVKELAKILKVDPKSIDF